MVFLGRLLPPWLKALRILPVAVALDNEKSKHKVELPVARTAALSPRLSISGYEPAAKAWADGYSRNSPVPVLDNADITRGSVALASVEDSSNDNNFSKPTDARQINCSIDVIEDIIFKSFDSIDDLNESTRQEKGIRDLKCETSGLASVLKGASLESGMNSRVSAGPSLDWNVQNKLPSQKQGSASTSTGLSQYQMIRERNIAERKRRFAELGLMSISEYDNLNGEGRKAKRRKKGKEITENEPRRKSARPTKRPATYLNDDKDPDWMPDVKTKTQMKRKLKLMLDSYPYDNSETDKSGRRPKRNKKKVTYEVNTEERADEFIFCDICQEAKHHGCKTHPVMFDRGLKFDIGPSKAGKNAGDGVFNCDALPIPQGVLFGKYGGKFYDVKSYNKMKKNQGESGNAWALRDRDLNRIIGYVDPGWKPDIRTNWMAYVNCASKNYYQNLWPGQYTDGIYYRSMRPIQYGEELLTYYGRSYALDLNIKVDKMELYEGKEDWTEKGVVCQYCKTGYKTEEKLKNHIEMASTPLGGCKVRRSELNKANLSAGLLPFVCDECGKGFDDWKKFKQHEANHKKNKPCPSICEHCGITLKTKAQYSRHVRNVHVLKPDYACPLCDKKFVSQGILNAHLKSPAHNKERDFKCPQCGQTFVEKIAMERHIAAVHNRELAYKCDECDKRFHRSFDMEKHKTAIHKNERNWICEDCNAAYVSKWDLNEHRIVNHTFDYPMYCLVCDKGFMRNKDMSNHYRVWHPEDFQRNEEVLKQQKPAVCSKCGKRFKTDEEVIIHKEKMHS